MGETKIWMLFDGRYRTNEDKAVCLQGRPEEEKLHIIVLSKNKNL